jgi:hypothetical protein
MDVRAAEHFGDDPTLWREPPRPLSKSLEQIGDESLLAAPSRKNSTDAEGREKEPRSGVFVPKHPR